MKAFFSDPIFIRLYLHKFCFRFGVAAMYVFTGAFFLSKGMALHWVILFFGLEFGLRGLLCPYGLYIFKKLGMPKAVALAMTSMIVFFVMMTQAGNSLPLAFSSFIFHSIGGAIYYPFSDVMEALMVKDNTKRSKQYSFSQVSEQAARFSSTVITAYMLGNYSFLHAAVMMGVVLLLAVVPLIRLNKNITYVKAYKPNDLWRFIAGDQFRPFWPMFFAAQLIIIMGIVMVPIYLYLKIGDIESYGYIMAVALILEAFVLLSFGHYIDQHGHGKSSKWAAGSFTLSTVFYAFFVTGQWSALFGRFFGEFSKNMFFNIYMTSIHQKLQTYKGNIMVFGGAWQMSLCLGELIVLPIYALLAYFYPQYIFELSFIVGVAAVWYCRYVIKHKL